MTQVDSRRSLPGDRSLLNERMTGGCRPRWRHRHSDAVESRRVAGRGDGVGRGRRSARAQVGCAGPEDARCREDGCAGPGRGAARRWPSTTGRLGGGRLALRQSSTCPATCGRGDPTGPLRWTCSSAARLSRELQEAGHRVQRAFGEPMLLHALGYTAACKRTVRRWSGSRSIQTGTRSSTTINRRRASAFQRRRQPVVSVATKTWSSSALSKMRGGTVASFRSPPSCGSGPRGVSGQGPRQGDSVWRSYDLPFTTPAG